jgi:hypothetical protein
MSIELKTTVEHRSCLQLLVVLSRLELTRQQEGHARELCQVIGDWEGVAGLANQRFVLPLLYRHLKRITPDNLPAETLSSMRERCVRDIKNHLLIVSAYQKLVQDIFQPLDIPQLFFKGYSLSACYYDEPSLRFSRDIDVLVPRHRIVDLLEAALEKGYRPVKKLEQLATDRTSLAYLARVQGVVTLVSPMGVIVEFHQRLDYTGTIYDTDELLAKAETLTIGDLDIPVMPTAELFVYICLHHTKHYWSHLHWLVDLDAIQRHPSFDLDEVYACAAKRNLTATVSASLELYRALASADPWGQPMSEPGKQMLAACFSVLQGGCEAERSLKKSKTSPDFSFLWQASKSHWVRWRIFGWIRLFRPSYADYQSWPLPQRWQWLYRVTRPFREFYTRVETGFSAKLLITPLIHEAGLKKKMANGFSCRIKLFQPEQDARGPLAMDESVVRQAKLGRSGSHSGRMIEKR